MKMSAVAVLGVLVLALSGCVSERATCESGFVPLFNGRDLTGWEGATNTYCVSSEGFLTCVQADGRGESGTKDIRKFDFGNGVVHSKDAQTT